MNDDKKLYRKKLLEERKKRDGLKKINQSLSADKKYHSLPYSFSNHNVSSLCTKLNGKWHSRLGESAIDLDIIFSKSEENQKSFLSFFNQKKTYAKPISVKCKFLGLTGGIDIYNSGEDFLKSIGEAYLTASVIAKKDRESFFLAMSYKSDYKGINEDIQSEIYSETYQLGFNVIFYEAYEEIYDMNKGELYESKSDLLIVTVMGSNKLIPNNTKIYLSRA